MLIPISAVLFSTSSFADQFIADMQQSYAVSLNPNHDQDAAELHRLYDHLRPFVPQRLFIAGHCVVAYATDRLDNYRESFAHILQQFLWESDIQQLYLVDFIKSNLFDFPFENFHKRNRFK